MSSYYSKEKEDWRNWLKKNHLIKDSIWLIFSKKDSPNPNRNWGEAVDEALCFGWIVSTKKSIDDEKYMQCFCNRKPISNWSKRSKDKVKILIEQACGLVTTMSEKANNER